MSQNVSDLPVGLQVASQIPLSFASYKLNEAALADLGAQDNLAFTYHKGMPFYCAEEKSTWTWEEVGETVNPASVFLLTNMFLYPDNWVVNGIDYSNKHYNFVKNQNVTLENVANYIIPGAPGNGIANISYNNSIGVLTITMTNSVVYTTGDIRGTNGTNGISITGVTFLGSAGLNDTYRISFSNGTFFDYNVVNGQNGTNGITPIMTRSSNTSETIASSGSKTFSFVSTPNLGWAYGMRLRFANIGGAYMEGVITSVGPTAVVATMDNSSGAGTFTSWSIGIAGDVGKSDNPQKTITYPADFTSDNYDLTAADDNYTIYIDNGSNNITITVDDALPSKIITAFVQKGSGLVTFVASATVINSPTGGLKIKGQRYCVAVEREVASTEFTLLGNTKV